MQFANWRDVDSWLWLTPLAPQLILFSFIQNRELVPTQRLLWLL